MAGGGGGGGHNPDLLGCSCIGDCIARGVEGNEERIPFCGNFVAAKLGQVHSHDTVMQADGFHHGLVIPLPHLCAALHVRAYKSDAGLSCRKRTRGWLQVLASYRRRRRSWLQASASYKKKKKLVTGFGQLQKKEKKLVTGFGQLQKKLVTGFRQPTRLAACFSHGD